MWHLLGSLDPSPLLAAAKSVDGRQGRDVLSIRMRLTRRRYAISEGIGSGREIARRLKSAPAFQCIVANTRARTPKPAQDVLPEAGYEGFAARRAGLRRDPGIGREAHGGQPLAHEPRGPGVHPE